MENSEVYQKRLPIILVLLSGAFVAILNQTLLATALPHIMHELDLTENVAQWLQSVFMLVNGIMIPITAFLIERFTTRKLFLTAIGLFALGTLICAIAPSFAVLMVGRIIQGAGAGIIMPLMQTILFLIYPIEKRGSAMGMFGLVIAFAPAIGPTLSGWLVDQFPWRSVFYVILPIAIIDFAVAYFILKNVTKQTFPKVDILSIILSTLGFGGILYGFSMAGSHSWLSAHVYVSLIVGIISLFIFITRQLRLKKPILEFRVFQYRVFSLATILGMIVFMSMISAAVVLPLYMQNMLGFTAFESGVVLLPGAIFMGMMNPISGKLFDKFGVRWLGIIGFFILCSTTLMLTFLSSETTFTYLAVVHAIRMIGMSMVMMPVTTAGLNQLPKSIIHHGTAMNNTMRQVAGAIGTALIITIMTSGAIEGEGVEGMIVGVNLSFIFLTILALIGFIIIFFIKQPKSEELQ